MRRISWVRIDLTGAVPTAEVAGVGQRRPVIRSIPVHVATRLADAGVRTLVSRPVDGTAGRDRPEPVEVA